MRRLVLGAHSVLLGGPVGARLRPLLHTAIATVVADTDCVPRTRCI
jgi:hypothetical protein